MGVKSVFLDGFINEKVYFKHSHGFEDLDFLEHVLNHRKALNGLKQAPRALYDRLCSFLIENDFKRGQ